MATDWYGVCAGSQSRGFCSARALHCRVCIYSMCESTAHARACACVVFHRVTTALSYERVRLANIKRM